MPIFERIPLGELFGKTPFKPLLKHIEQVKECVYLLRPLLEAFIAGDYKKIEEIANEISRLEHMADETKTDIRIHFPKRWFMPVERGDILSFLKKQDTIADKAEDAARLMQVRKTKVPPEIADDLREFTDVVIAAVDALEKTYSELERLFKSGFGDKEREVILQLIKKIDDEEWKADQLQLKITKKLFDIEDRLDPTTLFFLMRIINEMDAVADYAEDSGDRLRTMLAK